MATDQPETGGGYGDHRHRSAPVSVILKEADKMILEHIFNTAIGALMEDIKKLSDRIETIEKLLKENEINITEPENKEDR